jgi:outer membrane protein assembly factor BamB
MAIVGGVAVGLEQRSEQECAVCYDLQSGEELWAHGEEARFQSEHGDGPRSTPTIHAGRVYTCGATGIVCCLELATGELLWKRDLFKDTTTKPPYFGFSCSPLVAGEAVIVTPGIQPGGAMIALALDNGDELWRSGDDLTSYASPMQASLCGYSQILSFNGEGLRSYDHLGTPLWFYPWLTQGESRVNVAQPVIVRESDGDAEEDVASRVLISSGYEMGTALLQVACHQGAWSVETLWKSKYLKAKLSNFVCTTNISTDSTTDCSPASSCPTVFGFGNEGAMATGRCCWWMACCCCKPNREKWC